MTKCPYCTNGCFNPNCRWSSAYRAPPERDHKVVTLEGRPWYVWVDSCRFYVQPLDRDEPRLACLEFKHDMPPVAHALAQLMFKGLIDQGYASTVSLNERGAARPGDESDR